MLLWIWTLACAPDEAKPTPPGPPDPPGPQGGGDPPEPTDSADTAGDTSDTSSPDTGEGPPDPPVAEPALAFEGARPRNLLVISIDTTRRDMVGLFDDFGHTPNLTSLFSAGVVLEDHRSCSNWTAPSTTCLQTGRFPLDDGYWHTALEPGNRDPKVMWPPADLDTMATLLQDHGYYTELVTANSMFSTDINGPANGFQVEEKLYWQQGGPVNDVAIANLAHIEATEDPWYYHVHFMDPHGPYEAPAEFLPDPNLECPWAMDDAFGVYELMWTTYASLSGRDMALAEQCLLNVYGAELRYWDSEFARLWTELDGRGLLDDTLVVFWTDHGEQFGEHGGWQHGGSLYDQENRSTAAFWAKNIVPVRWSGPTQHQDIAPTIVEALGLPPGAHTGMVVGTAPADRTRVAFNYVMEWGQPYLSAVQGDGVLMYWWDGTKHFYDLSIDPDQRYDLYDPADPRVQALWDVLSATIAETEANWPGLGPVTDGP